MSQFYLDFRLVTESFVDFSLFYAKSCFLPFLCGQTRLPRVLPSFTEFYRVLSGLALFSSCTWYVAGMRNATPAGNKTDESESKWRARNEPHTKWPANGTGRTKKMERPPISWLFQRTPCCLLTLMASSNCRRPCRCDGRYEICTAFRSKTQRHLIRHLFFPPSRLSSFFFFYSSGVWLSFVEFQLTWFLSRGNFFISYWNLAEIIVGLTRPWIDQNTIAADQSGVSVGRRTINFVGYPRSSAPFNPREICRCRTSRFCESDRIVSLVLSAVKSSPHRWKKKPIGNGRPLPAFKSKDEPFPTSFCFPSGPVGRDYVLVESNLISWTLRINRFFILFSFLGKYPSPRRSALSPSTRRHAQVLPSFYRVFRTRTGPF